MVAIQNWVRTLEQAAHVEYRQRGGSQTNVTNQIAGLQQEIGEFERQVEKLQREKDAFPDCSFKSYFRRLIGLDHAGGSPAGRSATP